MHNCPAPVYKDIDRNPCTTAFIYKPDGTAGMTFQIAQIDMIGGGRAGISPLPGRDGKALADLSTIARWGADIVVSMTTMAEMARFGMEDLGRELALMDIAHAHFPIADFNAPPPDAPWADLSARLHATLDRGGKVLLHCMAGRGRSGMVALRLMVERGQAPDDALARLRAARPGAVETVSQMEWATAPVQSP